MRNLETAGQHLLSLILFVALNLGLTYSLSVPNAQFMSVFHVEWRESYSPFPISARTECTFGDAGTAR